MGKRDSSVWSEIYKDCARRKQVLRCLTSEVLKSEALEIRRMRIGAHRSTLRPFTPKEEKPTNPESWFLLAPRRDEKDKYCVQKTAAIELGTESSGARAPLWGYSIGSKESRG